jgi:hypothetical protein
MKVPSRTPIIFKHLLRSLLRSASANEGGSSRATGPPTKGTVDARPSRRRGLLATIEADGALQLPALEAQPDRGGYAQVAPPDFAVGLAGNDVAVLAVAGVPAGQAASAAGGWRPPGRRRRWFRPAGSGPRSGTPASAPAGRSADTASPAASRPPTTRACGCAPSPATSTPSRTTTARAVGHDGLATVVTPVQLPQLRRVPNDSIERALREAAQVAADRGVPVGRL